MSEYDKKVYREEIAEFLPQNIVDTHTHVYLKEAEPKASGEERKGCVQWTKMVAEDCLELNFRKLDKNIKTATE